MIGMKKLKLDKNLKSSLITYGMVIVAYIVMQALVMTGNISSLMKGLLVPLCIYSIMAVSLNLTVGILGELSLGHAGFMCVGAFSSAFFSKCTEEIITVAPLRFFLAILIGAAYLFIRRIITWEIPVCYLVTFAVFVLLFGGYGFDITYLIAEFCGGGLLLGAFFMATDYVTSPATAWGKVI